MYLSTEQFALPRPFPVVPPYQAQTLLENSSGALNEDVLLHQDHLFGVFDGATSLDKRKFTVDLTGGLLAARIAARAFQEGAGSLARLADKATRRIRTALLAENVTLNERHRLWSTSLAVLRLAEDRFEYCQTGDAPVIDIDRETLQLWKQSQAPETTTTTIHDLLAEQML